MGFFLLGLVVILLLRSRDPEAQKFGETIVKLALGVFAVLWLIVIIAVHHRYYPETTELTLYTIAAICVLLALREAYQRLVRRN